MANDKLTTVIRRWQHSTKHFVQECIGVGLIDDGKKIDPLQEKVMDTFDYIVACKSKMARGAKMTPMEKEYANKIGISIDSGRGAGKTSMCAWIIKKWLCCFHNSKVVVTAPKQDLLRDNMWGEVSKWIMYSKRTLKGSSPLGEWLTVQADKILHKGNPGSWYAVARTSSKNASDSDKKNTISGYHADFLLIVVDESYGVDDLVYDPLEATLTGKVNIIIIIGNPTKNYGFARETWTKMSKHWVNFRMNTEESTLVSQEYIERQRERYQGCPNLYRVNILGLPPEEEEGAFISYKAIQESYERELIIHDTVPITICADIGAGRDLSVCVMRQGNRLTILGTKNTKDTMITASWIAELADQYGAVRIGIDGIGVGHGVYDRLVQLGYPTDFINASHRSNNKERYRNLRAELFYKLRNGLNEGRFSIKGEVRYLEELSKELSMIVPKDKETTRNLQIISKKDMKYSPNYADAAMLSMYYSNEFSNVISDSYKRRDSYLSNNGRETTWMSY